MGLAGRKVKQRIGPDPRNLTWAEDASRFGQAYLAKFGWDSSKGLGASGEGPTSHIKVLQKLDLMGIGAAQQKDPNGLAWKQNKDFEKLLERLNTSNSTSHSSDVPATAVEGMVPASAPTQAKPFDELDGKKRKRSKEDKSEKKKRMKMVNGSDTPSASVTRESSAPVEPAQPELKAAPPPASKVSTAPRHRAHRARAIAAKRSAATSEAALAEILGITPTLQTDSSTTATTPSLSTTPLEPIEQITTSTKSLAEYFKEKLAQKADCTSPRNTNTPRPSTPSPGLETKVGREDGEPSSLRMGIGMRKNSGGTGLTDPVHINIADGLGSSMLTKMVTTLQTGSSSSREIDSQRGVQDAIKKKRRKKQAKVDIPEEIHGHSVDGTCPTHFINAEKTKPRDQHDSDSTGEFLGTISTSPDEHGTSTVGEVEKVKKKKKRTHDEMTTTADPPKFKTKKRKRKEEDAGDGNLFGEGVKAANRQADRLD